MIRRFSMVLTALLLLSADTGDAQTPIEPDSMMEIVKHLSGKDYRGRGLGTQELDRAAELIAGRFAAVGLVPGGIPNGSWYQEWEDAELHVRMKNVVGILPGKNPAMAGESVVIGAHYDHLGMGMFGAFKENQGKMHPGADDNASGMAVLLELASRLPLVPDMERSIVFVAFTGEEAGRRGSKYFVQNEKRYPVSKCVGMINLDTVGRMEKNAFIVLGSGSAKEWEEIFREAGKKAKVEIAFSAQELDSSDHRSFLEAGVPAVQLFTGPHPDYHRPTDTVDKINGKGMAKVATVARAAAFLLANSKAPLTSTVASVRKHDTSQRNARKTTIGAVPDFTYNEKGVRLEGTVPGGPAEKAGLQQGDIIIQAGTTQITVLKDLADVLAAAQPGDKITVRFLRNGKEFRTSVEVRER